MPHLAITGASVGIGRATVDALADHFDRITLIGRSAQRHREALASIPHASLVECELSSLESTRRAAASIEGSVDVFIANAGIAGHRGVTSDGFEIHFGVNHLGHHLLATALGDRITDRLVVVSSAAFERAEGIDWDRVRTRTRSLTGFAEYAESKLANVWFAREFARRTGRPAHVVHPGVVASEIWRRIPRIVRPLVTRGMLSPTEGARASVRAATAAEFDDESYLTPSRPRAIPDVGLDAAGASELWERSEQWIADRVGAG